MKRVRTISSSFQQSTDSSPDRHQAQKYSALDSAAASTSKSIRCTLPPHEPATFNDLASYEAHYTAQHSHRCTECSINLPSSYLLQLHIDEFHDPFVALKREAGEKTYKCFVEGCDKACIDWRKRRSHLVDKHGYPRNYDFLVIRDGIDGRSSLLRRGIDEHGHRKSSRERDAAAGLDRDALDSSRYKATADCSDASVISGSNAEKSTAVKDKAEDVSMDSISAGIASLKMLPSSISFGRQKGKTGFAKK